MTPIVRPFSSIAAVCAAVSMPSANPLTITTPLLESVFAISVAVLRPVLDAFRDPTIATRGLGSGISIRPAAKISRGANFLSTSLRGPNSCSGDKVGNSFRAEANLTLGDTSLRFSCDKLVGPPQSSPSWLTGLLRGDNTMLSLTNSLKTIFKCETFSKLGYD